MMGGQDEGDTDKHGGSQGRDELTRESLTPAKVFDYYYYYYYYFY